MLVKSNLSKNLINNLVLNLFSLGLVFLTISCGKDAPKEVGEIYNVVEEMPYIKSDGCGELADLKERKKCSDQQLLKFIYGNIEYPKAAKKNKTEGMALISFVITPEGDITNIEAMRDPGDGCGKEAIRIVGLMKSQNMWAPGKKDGKPVAVKYNMPIRFSMGDGSVETNEKGVYSKIKKMPYMKSEACNQADHVQQKKCGDQALLKFVADNVQYPEEAKKNKTEGIAVVSFVISPTGAIEKIQIERDLTDGCGSEAIRVVNLMSQQTSWVPGEKEGKAVAVKYNLPVRFKLQ